MTMFTDRVQTGIERAMSGVSLRQRVNADNLANAMTPGYRAQRVDFETSLASAMRSGSPASMTTSVRATTAAPKLDGNNVDVEQEVSEQLRSGLQYQALVQAANHKLGLLRSAIDGR